MTDDDAIDIRYSAETDLLRSDTTVVNMTNHSYFNLDGDPPSPIRIICSLLMQMLIPPWTVPS